MLEEQEFSCARLKPTEAEHLSTGFGHELFGYLSGMPSEVRTKLNVRRERVYTYICLIVLVVASTMLTFDLGGIFLGRLRNGGPGLIIEDTVFLLVIYYLLWGSVVYHLCRHGYLKRLMSHRPASRAELETIYDSTQAPALTVLVPSYREEERVVYQTLISAALMEYPDRRVVLLIDDPPDPSDPTAAAALTAMQELPRRIERLLGGQQKLFASELAAFEERCSRLPLNFADETRQVAALYQAVAQWMEDQASGFEVRNHTDALFVRRILSEPARAHRARAAELASALKSGDNALSETDLLREYRRLATLFRVRLTSFERKRFANLSHAPNKAMNLNSYIGLIGKDFREVIQADGLHLVECEPAMAHRRVPRADFVITVDADSLLLNDYAMRLIHVMLQPEGRDLGVVQTPYTAVPESPIPLERAAGAQTDLRWIMGQGATHYGATFWIGASALLRYRALEDICEVEYERGYPVKKYIQHRTLVEDTESTVDLIAAGWQLYNYPDRLSYSATPPDFGALVIQRRRWANGGLLILPKLVRHVMRSTRRMRALPEALLRVQYLVTPAFSNVAVLILLLYPFHDKLFSSWLPLTIVPYYALYVRDLVASDYDWKDLFRVYALDVLLLPVNLGGVAKSLQQAWTGRPTAFVRTPKVTVRTSAPPFYILSGLLVCAYTSIALFRIANEAFHAGRWIQSGFYFVNALALIYAFNRFVGIRCAYEDIVAGVGMRTGTALRGGNVDVDKALKLGSQTDPSRLV